MLLAGPETGLRHGAMTVNGFLGLSAENRSAEIDCSQNYGPLWVMDSISAPNI